MGIAYYYFCDKCSKVKMIPIAPFEPSDPGEETPNGWIWDDNGDLFCYDCGNKRELYV